MGGAAAGRDPGRRLVGYSRLVEKDEAGTLSTLKALRREVIDPLLAEHHGRIVKLMGDGALVEFGSVVDAVAARSPCRRALPSSKRCPPERRIVFRIGINLGDVMVEGEDLSATASTSRRGWSRSVEPGGV